MPSAIFISYSHKDEAEKNALLLHLGVLEKEKLIDLWVDDRIGAGSDWTAEIESAINHAQVAVLLISANFLTSPFILNTEVPRLLERRQREGLVIFPVIARHCVWNNVDWLARMNVRPQNGKPVWRERGAYVDEELAKIAREIADIARRAPPMPPKSGELTMTSFSQAHALVVGIAKYQYLSALSKTIADAQDVHDLLIAPEHCGYPRSNVTLLLNEQATRQAVINELAQLAQTSPGATVLIYFSGHGIKADNGPTVRNYLSVYETNLGNLNETAISGDEFAQALRTIPAQKVIVFFDVCHAGGIGQPRDPDGAFAKGGLADSYYQRLAAGAGRVIIASCKENELSFEFDNMRNGLFTSYLLEALKGQADVRGDGYVHIFDVAAYLLREVPQRQPSQHPVFHCVAVDQNFAVALASSQKTPLAPLSTTMPPSLDPFITTTTQYDQVAKRRLLRAMEDSLGIQDFELLCFILDVKPAFLPGQNEGLPLRFIKLMEYCQHRGRYGRLVEEFLNMRPHLSVGLLAQK